MPGVVKESSYLWDRKKVVLEETGKESIKLPVDLLNWLRRFKSEMKARRGVTVTLADIIVAAIGIARDKLLSEYGIAPGNWEEDLIRTDAIDIRVLSAEERALCEYLVHIKRNPGTSSEAENFVPLVLKELHERYRKSGDEQK